MGSGKPTDSSPQSVDAAATEAHAEPESWWRRIDEPWVPSVETVRVACGFFAFTMLLIALFRHQPGRPAIMVLRLLFVAYGVLGMVVVGRSSSVGQRIYIALLAISLPLFALYVSLISGSSPDTLSFAALAILCPMVFMITISDLLVVVVALIAGHAVFAAQFPEPNIGLVNQWILWSGTVFLGASVSFSLLVYRAHVRQSERLLERARDHARSTAQARSELLASMGDEIRTPMNGITGLIDLVLDTDLTDEQRRYLDMVKSDAHRLTSVLSDLLDLAKMHAHWLELEDKTFNLPDLLRATLTPMALRAEDKDVLLEWEMPRNLPVWVRGDATRLRQILVNLVDYLIEFAQARQVSVVASRPSTRHRRDYIKIEVHDRKGNLSEEQRDLIRKALVGLDAPPAKSVRKSGLGLAICAQLVHMMDGEIGLSENERGCTFWFTARLPRDEAKEKEAALTSLHGGRKSGVSARVLVVEDNPTNRVFAERVLQKAGHEVVTATNGREAVDILAEDDFDIVFMDLLMPVMNGLEAARAIREREVGTVDRVPIVALTAHVLEEQRQQCLDAGMDMHLGKPVHGSDLLDVVHRLVDLDESGESFQKSAGRAGLAPRARPRSGPRAADTPVRKTDKSPQKQTETKMETQTEKQTETKSETATESAVVFDQERLLDMIGGDHVLVQELLGEFLTQRVELVDELRQALDSGDADASSKLAHKLKGSLLALCADVSANLARELEIALRAGDIDQGRALFARLDEALDDLQRVCESLTS